VTLICVAETVSALTFVGAAGAAVGNALTVLLNPELPPPLIAKTRNQYCWPGVRPVAE
jgi:hypothetical protein